MPPRRKSRIYVRQQGGEERYYGDFRDFADVGGKREALIPPGTHTATTDPDVAKKLASDRVEKLERKRRNKDLLGIERETTLAEYAAYHLEQKALEGETGEHWLGYDQRHLEAAVEFFGSKRRLESILAEHCSKWNLHLAKQPNGRGGTLGPSTRRQYLNSLSNLYRRAASEGYVPPGFNPVAAMINKPQAGAEEARWLEVHEAALLLEATLYYKPERENGIPPAMLRAIIAAYLLTGGREKEVLGLEVDDISFDRKTVTFRKNKWRGLKSRSSTRSVPMWPQLEAILREYVFGGDRPLGELLFPSPRGEKESMITNLRSVLDALGKLAGWREGEIRTKPFRHTYCAARLQTTDRGAPVSEFTVSRELGHGGAQLVRKVYGHLGQVRHRSEVVEYRVEQHASALRDRLAALHGA